MLANQKFASIFFSGHLSFLRLSRHRKRVIRVAIIANPISTQNNIAALLLMLLSAVKVTMPRLGTEDQVRFSDVV